MLNGNRRQGDVGDKRAGTLGVYDEALKDFPMTFPRFEDSRIGTLQP